MIVGKCPLLFEALDATGEIASVAPHASVPSIAFCPFDEPQRDAETSISRDGITEEISNVLAQDRGLRVASASLFVGSSLRVQPGQKVDLKALPSVCT